MKSRVLFFVSLIGNLVLVITLAVVRKGGLPGTNPPPPAPAPAVAAAARAEPAVTSPRPPGTPFTWQMIASKDYVKYAAQLRAAGCPEWLVRDVMVDEIDRFYHQSFQFTPAYSPPWQNAEQVHTAASLQATRQADLDAEKQSLIKAVLGYDWDDRDEAVWNRDFTTSLMLGFLPDDKAFQVAALTEKYTRAAENIRVETHGILLAEDRAQLELLYESMQAEKSQLLNASEADELQLRRQAVAFFPAFDLHVDGVAVSGAELREIARYSTAVKDMVKSELVEERKVPAEERARRQAVLEQQVASLLGPERFTDYQRAQDFAFRETYDFSRHNNLTKAAAVGVYETRRAAEDQWRQLTADPSLSPAQQSVLAGALQAVTANAISARLGGAYQDYRHGPGQWLDALSAPPASPPTASAGGTP